MCVRDFPVRIRVHVSVSYCRVVAYHTTDGLYSRFVLQGLDRELQAIALARAEMRSKTPSAKVAARAVRSLKKKIARIREWELAREGGKELSEEQVLGS